MRGREAGTVFGDVRELAVAENAGVGIITSEILQQLVERVLLGLGPGIVGLAVLVEATFIDDTKGTVVVVPGMNALDGLRQERDDVAVSTDIVVVAALAVLGFTAGYQVLNAEGAGVLRGSAVDDQE